MTVLESTNGGSPEVLSVMGNATEPKVVDNTPWWRRGLKAGLVSFGQGSSETFGGRPPDGVGCWIVGRMCAALDEACGYEISENKRIVEKAWKVMDEAEQKIREHNRVRLRYRIVSIADIQPEPVEMVIDPMLPRGEVTILDGDPDAGKSWLWMALLAGLTGSKICPLPSPLKNGARDIQCALILTTEDSPEKTIRPRLEELGADLNRIKIVQFSDEAEMFFTASDSKDVLRLVKRTMPDIVVIDPLTLYAATEQGFDSNKATSVRKMLTPLVRVARKLNTAFLVNRHYGKTPKSAMHRGIGSIDYAATARSMIGVNKDPEDQYRTRIVSHIKSNLAPRMRESLTFILDKNLNPPFQWQGTREVDPDLLTNPDAASSASDEKTKLDEAMDFYQQILADGEVPTDECKRQAEELGISESTARRARRKLGVNYRQSGFGPDKKWVWYLP